MQQECAVLEPSAALAANHAKTVPWDTLQAGLTTGPASRAELGGHSQQPARIDASNANLVPIKTALVNWSASCVHRGIISLAMPKIRAARAPGKNMLLIQE